MPIELDSTRISTVVTCTDCPWWYGFADSKREGWQVGARHEQRAHPERDQARDAVDQQNARDRRRARILAQRPNLPADLR